MVKLGLVFKLNYAHVSPAEFIESYGVNHKQNTKNLAGLTAASYKMIF